MQPRCTFNPFGKLILALVILCISLSISTLSFANSRSDERQSYEQQEQQTQPRARITSSQAAAIVQQQYGGKVMNVQARQINGGIVYSVKILQSSGHMRTVNVDGQSGALLN